ncbi:DUF192 domain-containing protein [Thermococcus sp. AM4]|uniref:DUF192 domain-containing protein n=1 Tax=Thermococcus sp. (strain AM4) TaxID=246969 RepID=UPI00018712AE|nr:DUF192 domain-containing protein [Thermococcus sp. AM4]EEB73119.1 hypothetical protein TAM4_1976 [Thermococcus sp. AM4]
MIINETKGRAWHGRVELADTFLKRFKGLMLVGNVNYALVFVLPVESRLNASIHMFFMLSDIDVIWLDSTRRVVDFTTARKWRVYTPKKSARYIIEGPVGLIRALDVGEGDLISWQVTERKEKSVPVKVSLPGKVSFENGKGSVALVESVSELKTEGT